MDHNFVVLNLLEKSVGGYEVATSSGRPPPPPRPPFFPFFLWSRLTSLWVLKAHTKTHTRVQ